MQLYIVERSFFNAFYLTILTSTLYGIKNRLQSVSQSAFKPARTAKNVKHVWNGCPERFKTATVLMLNKLRQKWNASGAVF